MIIDATAAWLLTVFLHLGLALGLAHLLSARMTPGPWRERLWRTALGAALLTAGLQSYAGNGPLVWHWGTSTEDLSSGEELSVQVAVPTAAVGAPDLLGSMDGTSPPLAGGTTAPAPAESGRASGTALFVVCAWLTGVLFVGLRQSRSRRNFLGSLDRRPLRDGGDLRGRMLRLLPPGGRMPRIRLSCSRHLHSPVVLSGREICLPTRALEEMEDRELEATLAHELAHVVRRDPLWLRVHAALEAIFFFQPLVRHATARLRVEAELACDDWAVGRGADPLGLAHSLARIAAWVPPRPVPLALSAMAGTESCLIQRVVRLTKDPVEDSSPLRVACCLGALALGLGAFACSGPGVSSGGTEEARLLDGAPETLHFELNQGGVLLAEGLTWRVPGEEQLLREFLEVRNGVDDAEGRGESSKLRVVIEVEEGVAFSQVQRLMESLASQRIWRIELAVDDGPNLRIPLPTALDLQVEEEGPSGPGSPTEEVGGQPAGMERIEVTVRVRSQEPRQLQYSIGPYRTGSLAALGEQAKAVHDQGSLGSVVIDARPGTAYEEVKALIDALLAAGLTDLRIMFTGAYGE